VPGGASVPVAYESGSDGGCRAPIRFAKLRRSIERMATGVRAQRA